MNVIITGATGMVGKGALLECLDSDQISNVLSVSRSSVGISHPKLTEVLLKDIGKVGEAGHDLSVYDACFYCMGVSSAGMNEEQYYPLTYTLTERFAEACMAANPDMAFLYISGMGTDSTEGGRIMWARVKGKIENRLLDMGFGRAFMFRPGAIVPERGIKSRTRLYQVFIAMMRPFFPLLKRSKSVVTTTQLGQAMIVAAAKPIDSGVYEAKTIKKLVVK